MPAKPFHKRCTTCHETKRLAIANFIHRGEVGRRQEWQSRCRACYNKIQVEKSRAAKAAKEARAAKPAIIKAAHEPGKICALCGSMPWRVDGIRCPRCLLRYAAEPVAERRQA